jgi:murein DD-endopeptidase
MRRLPSAKTGTGSVWLLLAGLLLVGCASTPPTRQAPSQPVSLATPATTPGQRLAALAAAQLGQPYRFGGDDPDGFDCSGLVLFVHQQLGISVPRTAAQQRLQSAALDRTELQAGDLVFFTMGPRLIVDHVGIYVGEGRFVHAPRAGSPVRLSRIDEGGYRQRFAGGARFWSAGPLP